MSPLAVVIRGLETDISLLPDTAISIAEILPSAQRLILIYLFFSFS